MREVEVDPAAAGGRVVDEAAEHAAGAAAAVGRGRGVQRPQPVDVERVDCASVTVQLTLTLLRYHPLLPSVPVTVGVITGGVVSGTLTM